MGGSGEAVREDMLALKVGDGGVGHACGEEGGGGGACMRSSGKAVGKVTPGLRGPARWELSSSVLSPNAPGARGPEGSPARMLAPPPPSPTFNASMSSLTASPLPRMHVPPPPTASLLPRMHAPPPPPQQLVCLITFCLHHSFLFEIISNNDRE